MFRKNSLYLVYIRFYFHALERKFGKLLLGKVRFERKHENVKAEILTQTLERLTVWIPQKIQPYEIYLFKEQKYPRNVI